MTWFSPAVGAGRTIDVLILGAGPAGAALALALKRAGVASVLLVDRSARPSLRMGESAAPGLNSLLRRLGLDDRLEGRGHRPCYGNLSLWGGPTPIVEEFATRADGPGWNLDREAFDAWLRAEAVARGATLESQARLAAVVRDGDGWRADIRTGERNLEVRSRWIVDASGRPAAFARRSGARLHRFDRLVALAVRAEPAESRGFDGFSVIEAVEIGWWYAARLPGGKSAVALMTDMDIARETDLQSPDVFRQAWASTAEVRRFASLPDLALRPVLFAAGTQFIDRAIGPGWLALGDALVALDPLSASGVTGALEDAIAAAEAIIPLLGLESRGGEARNLRSAYCARANATLTRYLVERRSIYRREKRWGNGRFWQRRAVI